MEDDDFRFGSRHLTVAAAPTESDQQLYLEGSCHLFALALHRMHGFGLLVFSDLGEVYWEDPEDPDNTIPAVLHVYAVDGDGVAWDVLGGRPREKIVEEMRDRHWNLDIPEEDDIASEASLMTYVDHADADDPEGSVDRPLHSIRPEDVAEATADVSRILGQFLPPARNPTP